MMNSDPSRTLGLHSRKKIRAIIFIVQKHIYDECNMNLWEL